MPTIGIYSETSLSVYLQQEIHHKKLLSRFVWDTEALFPCTVTAKIVNWIFHIP